MIIDQAARPFTEATAYIRLENVSRADAASPVVAEQIIHNVTHETGKPTRLQFCLSVPTPDEKVSYAVRAHVDLDGDGQVSRGDYISMESYPVLTYGYPHQVAVRVREVK